MPQVAMSDDETYGMRLMVDTTYGVPVVRHGGDLIRYHSDVIWLLQQNVGAVILTNADPAWLLRNCFHRRLLEAYQYCVGHEWLGVRRRRFRPETNI